ncbi:MULTISPECIES: ABC transporter ATP-binding protein [unclassified Brenneria]|uniref:ABC transporter ATP-binding protein n=1 Tax=unclassified Brenneria TaxID=2634434 RepID=UPI001556CBE1|nr:MULTISPECIES: dipeptide/oligopeptide/nickel ABC transporter ATP-binding protein [unclassified Brenneria]MBJ7220317.1 ABC transporter ATP-binding protein [Brenneria sp. L3-3C-1]MEE3641562.1 dipeptide/oligopeptide/nickel ABC transporter ATP-binding protein [Brenneria sp. L3_3C_1]MEE3649807.1 dipeptide/oligopeptide/nickel ABC transporter ATP-binding protein [Brenneria sp. HEZEL_4_2_4]NPC99766.1 ABC transporter ATP-binding protein [Brenneria sp. hezel4-2-4]
MNRHLHAISTPFLRMERVSRYRQAPRFRWRKADPAGAIFRDLSLTLQRHERVGLVGASGCGKSTLLKTLLALDTPDSGTIHCDGQLVRPGSVRSLLWYRRRVQYIPQDPAASLDPRQPVGALIAEPLKRLRSGENISSCVRMAMDQVGLSVSLCSRPAGLLSGGQAQRVAMARALVTRPAFLLADEPTSGLDLPLREQIKTLLQQVTSQNNMGLLMVSHDISLLAGLCERMLVMDDGRIIEDRPTADVLASPQRRHTHRLLQAIPSLPI